MARETFTPVEFYINLTIREFFYWRENIIKAINEDKKNRPKRPK